MRKLTAAAYAVSRWSGGSTTQLYIYPETALYADRDFIFRVSSALVETEESTFTALPAYDRLIAPLKGSMALSHNGGPETVLRPYETHAFDGADETRSRGVCTDFNLMCRKGAASGAIYPVLVQGGPVTLRDAGKKLRLLYCAEGAASVMISGGTLTLAAGETLFGSEEMTIQGNAACMAAEITLSEAD